MVCWAPFMHWVSTRASRAAITTMTISRLTHLRFFFGGFILTCFSCFPGAGAGGAGGSATPTLDSCFFLESSIAVSPSGFFYSAPYHTSGVGKAQCFGCKILTLFTNFIEDTIFLCNVR